MKKKTLTVASILLLFMGGTYIFQDATLPKQGTLDPQDYQQYLKPTGFDSLDVDSLTGEIIVRYAGTRDSFRLPEGIVIQDFSKALEVGVDLFHEVSLNTDAKCGASCHNISKGGLSAVNLSTGGKEIRNVLRIARGDTLAVDALDFSRLRTPAIKDLYARHNGLHNNLTGRGGFNAELSDSIFAANTGLDPQDIFPDPLAQQFEKAEGAHNFDSFVAECEKDPYYIEKFKAAFGQDSVSRLYMKVAFVLFQKSMITNQTNMQAWLKGISPGLHNENGFVLFDQHCSTCHVPGALGLTKMAPAVFSSDLPDRSNITGNPADSNLYMVQGLTNARDAVAGGFFHNKVLLDKLYDAAKLCSQAPGRNIDFAGAWDLRSIVAHLNRDQYDYALNRYYYLPPNELEKYMNYKKKSK